MNSDSNYVRNIQNRTYLKFLIGILARLQNYVKYRYNYWVAKQNGAVLGYSVTLPLTLAKRANFNLKIGNNVSIQSSQIDLRCPVEIGNNVIIGSNVEIITMSHNIDLPNWEHKSYGIRIQDYAWLATNVLVLPSCREIGYGAVIAGGSVVVKNVKKMNVVGGNPSQLIRLRKEVHYDLCVESLLGNDLETYIKARSKDVA